MDAELQKSFEERKKEAEKKDIAVKAFYIAKYLGQNFSRGDYALEYQFQNDRFLIKVDMGRVLSKCSKTIIFYDSAVVFSEFEYDINSFVPGCWEEEFGVLNKQAMQKHREQVERDREERSRSQAEADQKERKKRRL